MATQQYPVAGQFSSAAGQVSLGERAFWSTIFRPSSMPLHLPLTALVLIVLISKGEPARDKLKTTITLIAKYRAAIS